MCSRFTRARACFAIPFVFFALFVVDPGSLQAHPVPRRCHDRTITVRLGSEAILVDYRLEVDEFTVVFDDLPALGDQVDLTKLHKPQEFYEAFARSYAPILAANLVARLDARPLEFHCIKHDYTLRDENGTALDHLRCDFVFRANLTAADTDHSQPHTLTFKEGNYELEEGRIQLALSGPDVVRFLNKTEPDTQLKARAATELQPGDDAKLRNLKATFTIAAIARANDLGKETSPTETAQAKEATVPGHRSGLPSLYELFRDTQYGFLALLCLSAAFGALHALTPGHGKTLVAAYLVGERGTVAHALLLGLVTTLTHTGVVLAIAIGLRIYFPYGGMSEAARRDLQMALGLGGGLIVAGLGAWLLLRRLSGQADHFHLGPHGHDHYHGHGHAGHSHDHDDADHYRDSHGHVHRLPETAQPVSWWGLVLLGVSGGIVPCWDAILMLLVAVSTNLVALALPMLLAFSAGLASVLIGIGILVVRVKGFAGSHWGESRLFRALPVISAVLVTGLGLWLCYDSVHCER
jgi:ABC-type nickel/cobalt efflux system permease component RcnA